MQLGSWNQLKTISEVKRLIYDKNSPKLLAKYTTRISGKQYRLRKLEDAIQLRKENDLPV